jgi:hypothetical protein
LYDPEKCPFCDRGVTFDCGLDLNICYFCGAQETAKGWMSPLPLPFRPKGKDTMTLAPDKELLRQRFTLKQKLGNHAIGGMPATPLDPEILPVEIRKDGITQREPKAISSASSRSNLV